MNYNYLYNEPPPLWVPTLGKFASANGESWHGIDKLLEFDPYDAVGSPNLIAIDRTRGGLVKLAGAFPKAMLDKIADLEDNDPDKCWIVCNALGATEKWGANRNGDSFPRMGLMNADPDTYGHKTWEKHAHFFVHHQNKDPKKAIGKIPFALYDDVMDKVMFLAYILKSKAPQLVDKMEREGSFPTSIGVKCPYDVCSYCGHKAKDRTEYCNHLKNHMLAIFGDGQQVMADTPHPRGFDHSGVIKGADPISHALTVIDPKGQAKAAWDSRPKIFVMPGMEKTAAPSFGESGIPMGDPEAPRMSQEEMNAYLDERLNKVNSEDLKIFRKKFHKDACYAPDGKGCTCTQKVASMVRYNNRAYTLDDLAKKFAEEIKEAIVGKDSEIIKQVPGMAEPAKPSTEEPLDLEAFAKKCLWVLEAEPDLPVPLLDKLAEMYDVRTILSSLGAEGIVLKPTEFAYLLHKKADTFVVEDIVPSPRKVSSSLRAKVAHLAAERSCLPEHLYQRSLDLLRPLTKVADGIPPGSRIIIIEPPANGGGLSSLLGNRQGGAAGVPQLPGLVPALMALQALYSGYRTNLGRADIHKAFDEPVEAPGSFLHKGASAGTVTPTRAYIKYAHMETVTPAFNECPAARQIQCDSVPLVELIAEPLDDPEKVATVLALNPGHLLDVVTTLTLQFVSDALPGRS